MQAAISAPDASTRRMLAADLFDVASLPVPGQDGSTLKVLYLTKFDYALRK